MEEIISSENQKEISKNAHQKLQKEQTKEKLEQEKEKSAQMQKSDYQESWNKECNEDPLKENYGDYDLIQSQDFSDRNWIKIQDIDDKYIGQTVLIHSRLHKARMQDQVGFLILRQQISKMQALILKDDITISKTMFEWIKKIPIESIIDIYGIINKTEQQIKNLSCKLELKVNKIYVVSRSSSNLPIQIEDAERKNVEFYANQNSQHFQTISLNTRLQNRIIDLRTSSKQAIFKMQSGICQLFREYLYSQDFIEIHTPKINDNNLFGSDSFKLKYFDKDAYLAQSTLIHKQMCIQSDFERVFEVGPVFRLIDGVFHCHMCEFTSLDIEMSIKENYNELIDLLGLETRFNKQIEIIQQQFPFEPIKIRTPVVKITFEEACLLLKEVGVHVDPQCLLDIASERQLGRIILDKYDTDFFILHKYPISTTPFYNMVCQYDPNYTLSFTFFVRGQEICSGAQREHDIEYLIHRAANCGINIQSIQSYIESLEFGAYPHGGCAIGLERFLLLYCNLFNIRNGCLFPRDSNRISP